MNYQAIAHTIASRWYRGPYPLPVDDEAMAVEIADIAAALAACERDTIEQCAQVAEAQAGGHYMARVCATAIRALIPPA